MAEHNRTGKEGEQFACQFLAERGYEVLARNWRHGKLELDLVARHGDFLVFVEVKARSTIQHGEPEESVGRGKRGKLIRAANAYIAATGCDLAARFDIVSVVMHPSGKPFIRHIPDAFYPSTHDRPF